jgi:hypothetical protein
LASVAPLSNRIEPACATAARTGGIYCFLCGRVPSFVIAGGAGGLSSPKLAMR